MRDDIRLTNWLTLYRAKFAPGYLFATSFSNGNWKLKIWFTLVTSSSILSEMAVKLAGLSAQYLLSPTPPSLAFAYNGASHRGALLKSTR